MGTGILHLVRAGLVIAAALSTLRPAAAQDVFSPGSCGAEVADLAALIACRKLQEPQRDQRCASEAPHHIAPPTSGQRLIAFGQSTRYGSSSKGVVFDVAEAGSAVTAPAPGRVVFAGHYRSYGNIVVIDACRVDVLISGMAAVAAETGALLERGAVIGKAGGAETLIYLEVRRGSEPVDPFSDLNR